MSEKERKIMEKCGEVIPRLSEMEKEKFLSFTEGVAFITAMQQPRTVCDSALDRGQN